MTCKRSEQCDHADLCRFAKSTEYNLLGGSCFEPKDQQTNEEWLRQATTEQLANWIVDEIKNMASSFLCKEFSNKDCKVLHGYYCEWLKEIHHAE